MTTRLLILILLCVWRSSLVGSPADDLSSPSQEVRDAAARILRATYTAPSRTNWEALVNSITNGTTMTNLLELLSPYHVKGGYTYFPDTLAQNKAYRLDDEWIVVCWFRGDILAGRTLDLSLRIVWVDPPTNFSGIWITYFVNGQKSHEIHYKSGKCHGEWVTYHPDGSKRSVQNYDHQIAEGADTGLFPSGRTNWRGIYKRGKQVGTWTWYNEDGSVKSTYVYSK